MTATTRVHLQRAGEPRTTEGAGSGPRLFHRSMPRYEVTDLISLPDLAAEIGVAEIMVKDESQRFGLPSFKILGGSWAVHRLLSSMAGEPVLGRGFDDLLAIAERLAPLTLVTATDGNHGHGVARMAKALGLSAVVVAPADMVASRRVAIASEGAEVRVVDGNYDHAVRTAADLALSNPTWHLVADVAFTEGDEVPRWVMEGYYTIFDEVDEQLPQPPTTLFVQTGVGALAGAALGYYEACNPELRSAIVEPLTAACLYASAVAGRLVSLDESQGSMMAGLNCGTPSSVAWPTIHARTSAFVAIDDDVCADAMRVLAKYDVVAGESGAAGLAGLLAVVDDRAARQALGIDASSRILTVNTEGATDPDNYHHIVGSLPATRR